MNVSNPKTDRPSEKPFLAALRGIVQPVPPVWLMRQAGRYLPEYRALREKASGFLDIVFAPETAAEITLQPVRRFGMDAAILFSDILVIPHALGCAVRFAAGEGPVLSAVRDKAVIDALSFDAEKLTPVSETLKIVRKMLSVEGFRQTALIGFAGAPWTVAAYMVEGGGSRDFERARRMAYSDPALFGTLIGTVTEATITYLLAQIEAGAEAVQLFDSWAGLLDEIAYERWVIEPTWTIAQALKARAPSVPLIGFPRGSGALYERYAAATGVDALGLDQHVPLSFAASLQKRLPVQGNLDPVRLLAGGRVLEEGAQAVLDALADGPFIFNLGHGVIKDTPPEHVARLLERIRA